MNFTSRHPFALAALTTVGLALLTSTPARANFLAGDILLNNYSGSNIQQYRNGSLIKTFTGSGVSWEGASLTPDGNLVTTFLKQNSGGSNTPGVDIFNSAGTQIASFFTPDISNPGDVSVFTDGKLAISDQFNHVIRLYNQSGTLLNTLALPGGDHPIGNMVAASDNTLYVADITAKIIYHLDESGTVLNQVNAGFFTADLAVAPDKSLFVTDALNRVVHFSATGTQLGAFNVASTGTLGIGLAPDALSLYVTGQSSSSVYHYDLTGSLLGSFAISNPQTPLFLTVVPGSYAPVPEPAFYAMSSLLVLGGGGLLVRRRKQRAQNAA